MTTENTVKTDVQNVVKFYDQIRLLGAVNSGINNQNGTALTNLIAQQGVCNAAFTGDFVARKTAAISSTRATLSSVFNSDITAAGAWVLRDWAQVLNVPETDSGGILQRVYDDYNANAKRVMSRGFTFGTPTAGTNTGNGVVFRLNVDENGYVLENQTADSKTAKCIQDATSGTEVWEELFEVRASTQPIDAFTTTGSGRKKNIAALSAKTSSAILRNPSFSQCSPAGATTSPTDITNWTCSPAVTGTTYNTIGGTGVDGYYRGFPGDTTPLALRIKASASLSQNLESQRSRFVRTVPYLIQSAWRRKASCTGTFTMTLGAQNTSVDVSTGTNDVWNTLRFTGTKCWFKNFDAAGLTFTVATSAQATGQVDIDDILICPLTAFDGSWYGFVGTPATGNPSQWLLNDVFTWSDTELGETYALVQKIFFWRGFGVYLPAIPKAPTTDCSVALAGAGAGNVDNGAHSYTVTFLDVNGVESGFSTASHNAVTVADKTTNGKVSVTAIPTGPATTASRNVYRSKAGTTTPFFLLTNVAGNVTTTYTDNTADASLGAQATTVVAGGITLGDPA